MANIFERAIVEIVKIKLTHDFKLNDMKEIPKEDLIEFRDIPYQNRGGKELLMDIYKPNVDEKTELPVIVNIHGGGLIMGDKDKSEGFCRLLAKRGYLVFSLEYRLVPAVNVYEQIDDVCAGMDCIGRKLVDFNVDIRNIFMVAESAGAYLAMYAAAMTKSKVLQDAIGYEPTRMRFKALGLISGMFYTKRKDAIGIFLSKMFYGTDERSKRILEYTNPENPEIIYNIPPVYLVTSKTDMVERYTLDFAGELGNKGIPHKLRHMGSYDYLFHAFPVIRPDLPESSRVADEITGYFKKYSAKD